MVIGDFFYYLIVIYKMDSENNFQQFFFKHINFIHLVFYLFIFFQAKKNHIHFPMPFFPGSTVIMHHESV